MLHWVTLTGVPNYSVMNCLGRELPSRAAINADFTEYEREWAVHPIPQAFISRVSSWTTKYMSEIYALVDEFAFEAERLVYTPEPDEPPLNADDWSLITSIPGLEFHTSRLDSSMILSGTGLLLVVWIDALQLTIKQPSDLARLTAFLDSRDKADIWFSVARPERLEDWLDKPDELECHLAELAIWEKRPGFWCACDARWARRGTVRCECTVAGIREEIERLRNQRQQVN